MTQLGLEFFKVNQLNKMNILDVCCMALISPHQVHIESDPMENKGANDE